VKASFLLICYLLIWLNFLNFNLWPQVIELHNSGAGLELFLIHTHGIRYTLTLPFFVVGNWLGVDYNIIFTLLSPLILILVPIFLSKVVFFYKRRILIYKRILFIFLSLAIILTAHFMNGRMLFGLAGFSMLSYCLVYWEFLLKISRIFLLLFSLIFMSVSSGVFMVGVISIVLFFLYLLFTKSNKGGFVVLLASSGLIYLLPLIETFIMKNIDYYGSIYLMLEHGYGKIIYSLDNEVLWMLLLIIVLLFSMQIFFIRFYKKYILLVVLFLVPVFLGMFGDSTLLMSFVPFLALFSLSVFSIDRRY
jgi:hypothetical protein